jgi:hypothetical protein
MFSVVLVLGTLLYGCGGPEIFDDLEVTDGERAISKSGRILSELLPRGLANQPVIPVWFFAGLLP